MNLFDGIINRKPVFANKDFRNTTDAFGSASNFFGTPQTNASINKQYAPSVAPIVQKAKSVPVKATPTTTDSWIYKKLSPFEQTAQMATESMQDTTKMYQQKAQDISQWGQDIAKKPGFEKLGQMVKVKFPEYNDLSDAELGMKWLKKFPEYSDIVEGEAQTTIGQGAKALGGIGSMAVSAPGMVTGGTEQLGTGLGTIASAQSGQDVAEGALQAGKGAVTAGFGVATGAMPISSTLFGGITGFDTAQKGLGYLGQKAGDLSAGTAGLLGGNQQVQEQARGFGEVALPALALGGVSKSGKVIKPVARATGKAIIRGAEMAAPKVAQGVKQLSKTPKVLGKLATTGTEYSTSLATGLSREAQKTIKQSPELYKQARLGGITAQGELGNFIKATEARLTDLSELGKGYESIKKGNKVASIDDITNAYVKSTEGVRDRTLTKADKLVIKDANDYMSQMKGQLDETDILGLRRQLDSIMYDPNTSLKRKLSPTGERIVNSMRSEIDKIAKERIVGLKELDAQYAPEVGLLKDIKKQIYDANGNIKPTALSTISNIVGKNKDFKLEQFQKIYPELGARIKALKAFEEVSAIGEMKTGSIARQLGGAALGSTVAPVIGTIAGWIATNPYVVARLLETYGLAKARISEILKKGAKITPEDAKIVQKAVVATPKAKVENIINNLSFDPKKEALTSKNLTPRTITKSPTKTTVNLQQSKGGFIKIPDIGKKSPVKNPLVEEARKTDGIGYGFTGKPVPGIKKEIKIEQIQKGSHDNTITSKENIDKLKKGEYDPILVTEGYGHGFNGEYTLVDGQHRYNTLKELGIKNIKVSVIKESEVGDALTKIYKGQIKPKPIGADKLNT